MTGHPQRWKLERWFVGELGADAQAEIASHLLACADCSAAVDELAEERSRLLLALPPARFVPAVEARAGRRRQRRRRRVGFAFGGAVATAAALVMLLTRPPPVTRLKGVGFTVERSRHGVLLPLSENDRIAAGDRLRVVVTSERPVRVAVWFVDEHGRVDALLDAPTTVSAGRRPLPGSVAVEEPCVDGWVVFAAGEQASAMNEAALRERLARAGDAATSTATLPGALLQRLRCE